jgi:secreted PhoX family phosphatase
MGELIEARISRRTVIAGGMAAVASFLSAGVAVPGAAAHGRGKGHARLLGFDPIPLGFGDEVVVPSGYTARPFIPWGTPILGSYPAFRPGANTAAEQAQQIGMHHDGMHYFPLRKGSRPASPPPRWAPRRWTGRSGQPWTPTRASST